MPAHKFKAGQNVTVTDRHGRFEIIRPLPETGGRNQYRVRSLADRHERVVAESELA
jgi:hypothetical protein